MTRAEWLAERKRIMASLEGCTCGACLPEWAKCKGRMRWRQQQFERIGKVPPSASLPSGDTKGRDG